MKAFTILEISLALFIVTLITISIFLLVLNITNFNAYFIFGLGNYQDIQLTFNEMKKELKSMQPSNIGNYPIEEASSTKLTFYSDLDNDSLIEKITYFVDNDVFKKSIIVPTGNPLVYDPSQAKTKIVVRNLVGPQIVFSYYDKNLQSTQDVAQIRIIKVNLKTYTDYKKKTVFEDYIIVNPRNLKEK